MTVSDSLLARLSSPSIVVDKALIANKWISASASGKTFEVTNPSTGEIIATLPDLRREETGRAIEAASRAQKIWARRTAKERSTVLRKLFDLLVSNAHDLAIVLTAEMGKPISEAEGEILYVAAYIEWFSEEARWVYGDTIPGHQADKRLTVSKHRHTGPQAGSRCKVCRQKS